MEGAGSISYILDALTMGFFFSITAGVKGRQQLANEENKAAAG